MLAGVKPGLSLSYRLARRDRRLFRVLLHHSLYVELVRRLSGRKKSFPTSDGDIHRGNVGRAMHPCAAEVSRNVIQEGTSRSSDDLRDWIMVLLLQNEREFKLQVLPHVYVL